MAEVLANVLDGIYMSHVATGLKKAHAVRAIVEMVKLTLWNESLTVSLALHERLTMLCLTMPAQQSRAMHPPHPLLHKLSHVLLQRMYQLRWSNS